MILSLQFGLLQLRDTPILERGSDSWLGLIAWDHHDTYFKTILRLAPSEIMALACCFSSSTIHSQAVSNHITRCWSQDHSVFGCAMAAFLCLYYNLSWSQPHLSIPFLVSLLASASLLAKSSFLLHRIHHFRRNLQVFSGFMVKNVQAPSFWPLPPAAFWGQPKAADGCFKGLATVVAFRLASWPSKFIQVLDPKFWALPHFPSILSHPLPHQTIPAKPSFHQWPSWHSRRCPTS